MGRRIAHLVGLNVYPVLIKSGCNFVLFWVAQVASPSCVCSSRFLEICSQGRSISYPPSSRKVCALLVTIPMSHFSCLVVRCGGIVITTYAAVRQASSSLSRVAWDYVILDEGHMIRNPTAEVTKVG